MEVLISELEGDKENFLSRQAHVNLEFELEIARLRQRTCLRGLERESKWTHLPDL